MRFPESYYFEDQINIIFKNGVKMSIPRFKICCVSPVVDQRLKNDQTDVNIFIDYEIKSECIEMFKRIINGESVEDNETNALFTVLVLLGNVDLYEQIEINNENVVERIIHKHQFQKSTEKEFEFVEKHFSEVQNKEKLPFEVIDKILSKLILDKENIILEFVEKYIQSKAFKESNIKHKKSKLIQHIKMFLYELM